MSANRGYTAPRDVLLDFMTKRVKNCVLVVVMEAHVSEIVHAPAVNQAFGESGVMNVVHQIALEMNATSLTQDVHQDAGMDILV